MTHSEASCIILSSLNDIWVWVKFHALQSKDALEKCPLYDLFLRYYHKGQDNRLEYCHAFWWCPSDSNLVSCCGSDVKWTICNLEIFQDENIIWNAISDSFKNFQETSFKILPSRKLEMHATYWARMSHHLSAFHSAFFFLNLVFLVAHCHTVSFKLLFHFHSGCLWNLGAK